MTSVKYTFLEWVERHLHWSRATFGDDPRPLGIIKHIRKELDEIKEDPSALVEWIDVIILAVDGAWRQGYSAEQIARMLEEKRIINYRRNWPTTSHPNEPTEHIKEVT